MLAVAMDSKGRRSATSSTPATRRRGPPRRRTSRSRWRGSSRSSAPGTSPSSRRTGSRPTTSSRPSTARALAEGWRVVIVSADKDLMQLVRDDDERVVLWDSMRDRVYGPAEVREKLGVAAEPACATSSRSPATRATTSPASRASGRRRRRISSTQFGSLDGIYAAPRPRSRSRKLRESLREHEADARLSQKLVTLDAIVAARLGRATSSSGAAPTSPSSASSTRSSSSTGSSTSSSARDAAGARARAATRGRGGARRCAGASATYPPRRSTPAASSTRRASRESRREARARGQVGVALDATSTDAMRADDRRGVARRASRGAGTTSRSRTATSACPPQLAWERVRARLAPLLADPAVTKVGHDLKQTSIVLARAGRAARRAHVRHARRARTCSTPRRRTALKELARRELGVDARDASTTRPRQDARPAAVVRRARRRARRRVRRRPRPRSRSRSRSGSSRASRPRASTR